MPYSASVTLQGFDPGRFTVTSAAAGGRHVSLVVDLTSTTELDLNHTTDIPTCKTILVVNESTQDTIKVGWATGVYQLQIGPGEANLITRPTGSAARIFAVCSVAALDDNQLRYVLIEE